MCDIEMDIREMESDNMDCSHLTDDMGHLRDVGNTVMNLQIT
jgi:hypothetical protein